METPREAAIVRAMEKLTGAPAGTVAFGTEGPYLNDLGLQTVICGPGHIDQAHQPDEYLPLEHIQPAINLIQSLVRQFCVITSYSIHYTKLYEFKFPNRLQATRHLLFGLQ